MKKTSKNLSNTVAQTLADTMTKKLSRNVLFLERRAPALHNVQTKEVGMWRSVRVKGCRAALGAPRKFELGYVII